MALDLHRWTRADLAHLPDDGNKREVVYGELLVSPAPAPAHWALVYALRRLLEPYCDREGLGVVTGENAPCVAGDSEAIPDLMLRRIMHPPPKDWNSAPAPTLVVEVTSPSTRRHDEVTKPKFYLDVGAEEYWIVDGESRSIRIVTAQGERLVLDRLTWHPSTASTALEIEVGEFFASALGPHTGPRHPS